MFEARSVAVVGASPKPGRPGHRSLVQLLAGGYDGSIYPVNPNYDEVLGRRCYASLEALPEPVDLSLLVVPNRMLEMQMKSAAAAAVRSVVIFASGHDEAGADLTDRVAGIALESGIAVCGGNCMGFVDVEHRLRALAFHERDIEAGPITWITQSGSAFTALLHSDRGLRFNLAVSSGQELTTSVADYMLHALGRESTGVIALFLETVRDPAAFVEALSVADRHDVPVVVLKVGNAPLAQSMVAAHSGALAGERAAFEAVCDAHGAVMVATMNELADTLELIAAGRRAGRGGLAALHDSGGERAHLVDVAADVGVEFADISARTTAALQQVLEPGLVAANPLDAWGTGNDADVIFERCMRLLLDDEETAALAFVVDLKHEEPDESYVPTALAAFANTSKPVAVLSNLSSGIDAPSAAVLRAAGMPVLEGTRSGLLAMKHLIEIGEHRRLPPVERVRVERRTRERWRARLVSGSVTAFGALEMLRDYGIDVAPTRAAADSEGAVAAAREVGYPIVMKAEGVAHKSDVGALRLGLAGDDAVRVAHREIADAFGPRVLVQATVPAGVELALGIVDDRWFGPLVMVAAGGLFVEVLGDRKWAVPPLDVRRAGKALDALAARPTLDGVRGMPPADIPAVIGALVRLSELALDLGDLISALDVNPLIAGPRGCIAVDALIVPREKGEPPLP
jgi:acetate---CoA ligase (ADP-forming)